jgi:hypothetical protein
MKQLHTLEEDQVYEVFPRMGSEDLFEQNIRYNHCSISVFDNWLTEDEASDDNAFSKFLKSEYEIRIKKFYLGIYKCTEVYCYFDLNCGGRALLSFSSEQEFLDWVDLSIQERLFLRLIIPELKVIINGGYDYTLPTFLTKDADISQLEKIVHDHGLYILK